MGANAQTSVPAFTAGQVLTAQQQTEINTGVPVFADATARNAAFGGTGEKVLAEGQLAYLEDSNIVQYYDGSNWLTVGPAAAPGLELVKSQTIGSAVASVTVSDAFSATYDNYRIIVSGGSGSTAQNISMVLGATNTGYYFASGGGTYTAGAFTAGNGSNVSSFGFVGYSNTDGNFMSVDVLAPNLAKNTVVAGPFGQNVTNGASLSFGGYVANTTSYTAFTLSVSGTMTGGVIRVYGYKN